MILKNGRRAIFMLAALALLGGCAKPGQVTSQLPAVPSDIQTCFRQGPVVITKTALTVADVESLWKKDRVRLVVERKCGTRFLAWYADLQKRWQ